MNNVRILQKPRPDVQATSRSEGANGPTGQRNVPRLSYSKYFWLAPACYMLGIFVLSSIPADANDRMAGIYINRIVQDFLHIPMYALLTLLWVRALKNRGVQAKKAIFYAIAICLLYSIFDEFHQHFVPGRYASFSDIVFNAVGSVMAMVVEKFQL